MTHVATFFEICKICTRSKLRGNWQIGQLLQPSEQSVDRTLSTSFKCEQIVANIWSKVCRMFAKFDIDISFSQNLPSAGQVCQTFIKRSIFSKTITFTTHSQPSVRLLVRLHELLERGLVRVLGHEGLVGDRGLS